MNEIDEDKIDYYYETNKLNSHTYMTVVLMLHYYNGNHTLPIVFKASKNSFFTYNHLNKFENNTFQINNKMFFIDLNIGDFKNGEIIFFEFKGNKSAFNSTQVYIRAIIKYEYRSMTYNYFKNCIEFEKNDEIMLSCNFTKIDENNPQLMLLLNEGNEIFVRNIKPQENKTSDNNDKDNNDKDNNILEYVYYIGIPIIILLLVTILIVIFIIKRKKKKINKIEDIPSQGLIQELNQASD